MIARSLSYVCRRSHVAGAIGLVCLVAGLSARGSERSTNSAGPARADGEIGERCIACHADIVRSYRATGMARALDKVQPGEFKGLSPVADGKAGLSYRFVEDGQRARIVESWSDPSASPSAPPAFEATAEIAYAIGAGLIDRSYAAQQGDLVWFAPLEVVSAHGDTARRAALAPGHEMSPGSRFTIPITEECLGCHTDRLPQRDYPLNLRPRRDLWQPSGISCAACHARAEEHAGWRERDVAGKKPDNSDPIAKVRADDPIESVSVCARCHLQGDARLALSPGDRGVPPPGGDLLASRAVFVAKFPQYDIGFVSHVERMAKSRCFSASMKSAKRALTCVTCHDPHRSSFDPAERSVVRAACLACHPSGAAAVSSRAGDAPAGDDLAQPCSLPIASRGAQDCVQCHMPTKLTYDVADVEIHDHFIQRTAEKRVPRSPLRAKDNRDGKLALFQWPGATTPAYADDPGLWMMALMAAARPELALVYADREPGVVSKALPMYHHVRGSLLERFSRFDEARAAYERALALDPAQAESQVNLGALLQRMGRLDEGLTVLDAAIAKHPRAQGALRNRALIKLAQNDTSGVIADLEAAFRVSPQGPVARLLSAQYRQIGRNDLADSWQATARRLDPPSR